MERIWEYHSKLKDIIWLIYSSTTEKRTVSDEKHLSLNFIFSSLNNLATKQRQKMFVSKPTVADEIRDEF